MTPNERWRQTKKNLKTVEQKKDSLTRSEPIPKNSNGRAGQGAKQDLLNRWNNSTMTSKTTRTTQKLSRESQMSPMERNDAYGKKWRERHNVSQPGRKTVEMYETALSGPPSKEWQEKKRKEESRKAAEAAAAQSAARAREEAARRGRR